MTRRIWFMAIAAIGLSTGAARATEPDEMTSSTLTNYTGHADAVAPRTHAGRTMPGHVQDKSGIPGIDSLVNWGDKYKAPGVDANGVAQQFWYFNMVGTRPNQGGTTTYAAPIVPVSVELLDSDGSQRYVNGKPLFSDATPFIAPVLQSPVFQNAQYTSSGVPTQFTDAIQRAEFFASAKPDWHTLLAPSVKPARVLKLPRGSYRFALNADGTCCRFILADINAFGNALFPATATDTTTPIGAAENAGDITTRDVSTFLLPNTYLYFPNGDCCVLGYHSYDAEAGDSSTGAPEKRYVVTYASWITPGLFGGGFQDVTALSHELAETFNDPFVVSDGVHDETPWWLAPNGNCQNDLEVGDVVEGLPGAVHPMAMNGFTYHPQNEALLQWFQSESPSSALGGAYSYPDPVLTGPNLPQKPLCAP